MIAELELEERFRDLNMFSTRRQELLNVQAQTYKDHQQMLHMLEQHVSSNIPSSAVSAAASTPLSPNIAPSEGAGGRDVDGLAAWKLGDDSEVLRF